MQRSKPIPDGFVEDFTTLTRFELMHRYSLDQRAFRELQAKMPTKALEEREYRNRKGKLIGSREPVKKGVAPDRLELKPLANPAAAAARLAHLIEAQKKAQAAAASVDRYAGLTGFDRQLAIARDRGVTQRVKLPTYVSGAEDNGLGMSCAAWAVSGGSVL
jgi:hypothetical protein